MTPDLHTFRTTPHHGLYCVPYCGLVQVIPLIMQNCCQVDNVHNWWVASSESVSQN